MKKIDDIVPKNRETSPQEEKKDENLFQKIKVRHTTPFKKLQPQTKEKKEMSLKSPAFRWGTVRSWILMALVFLLPLWFLPWGVDKLGLAKQVLLTLLTGAGMLIWFYEGLGKGKLTYAKSIVNVGIFILLLIVGVGTFVAVHPNTSLYASITNSLNFLNLILLAFFYWLVIANGKNKLKFKLSDVLLSSISLVSFYSLLQSFEIYLLGGFTRNLSFNSVGTVNSVGILAGLAVLLGMNKFLANLRKNDKKTRIVRVFLIAVMVVNFAYLLMLNFRTVWYGLGAGALLLIAFRVIGNRKKTQRINEHILPVALLIVALIMSFSGQLAKLGLWQPQLGNDKMPQEISLSFKSSLDIAKKTLHNADLDKIISQATEDELAVTSTSTEGVSQDKNSALKRLLFGSGLANYDKMWLKYRGTSLNQSGFWQVKFSQAGTAFFTWLTETGYLGMLGMALLMALVVLKFYQTLKKGTYSSQFMGAFIGIVFLGLVWFLYPFNLTLYFAFFLLMGLMSQEGAFQKADDENDKAYQVINFNEPIQKALIFTVSLIIIMVSIVFVMYFEVQRYVASAQTAKGLETIQIDNTSKKDQEVIQDAQEKINQKINLLVKAYNLDRFNDIALRQISQLYLQKINLMLQQKDATAATQQIAESAKLAIKAAQKAVKADKTDVANWQNLAQVYENLILITGDSFKLAVENYDKALEFDPADPVLYMAQGRTYFTEAKKVSSQIAQSHQALQKGQVKNKAKVQKMIKGLQEKRTQLLEKSIKKLKRATELKSNYSSPYLLLSQIYEAQGKLTEAIQNTSNLVLLNQKNAGLWFQLGLLYYKDDNLDKAEVSLSQAISLANDKYANARYFLGLVYARQKKTQKALNEFRTVVQDNPDNKEIKTIISNLEQGKAALEGVVPPAEASENREEAPVEPNASQETSGLETPGGQ